MIDYLCQNALWIARSLWLRSRMILDHIRRLSEAGILVAIGHSAANYEQAIAGFNAGIRFATHLYNAMTPTLNGREPGIVGLSTIGKISTPGS